MHWQKKGNETSSEDGMKWMKRFYEDKWTTSLVLEEMHQDNEYHVIVHITDNTPQTVSAIIHIILIGNFRFEASFWLVPYLNS